VGKVQLSGPGDLGSTLSLETELRYSLFLCQLCAYMHECVCVCVCVCVCAGRGREEMTREGFNPGTPLVLLARNGNSGKYIHSLARPACLHS
jgi:hypothetical protein